jgi:enamine deaminase RidA (YjgF/YER057c/UK114 family)
MKQAVKTGLPTPGAPIEWATVADGILYTAQIPLKPDGSIETGSITVQAGLTLANLKRTVEAAGGSLADVAQVLVYLPDPADFAGMNEVYRRYFAPPYPNRATIVAQLMVPGARIEIVAYAHLGRRAAPPARAKARAKAKRKAPARRTTRRTKRTTRRR